MTILHDYPIVDADNHAEHAGHSPAAGARHHLRSGVEEGVILAVDKSPVVLRMLSSILGAEGYRVLTTDDPARVLEITDPDDVDLVIAGNALPEVDSMSLLRVLRAKRPDVAVLLMTEPHDVGAAVAAVKGGAQDVLPFPFDSTDDVLVRVRKAIEHRRLLSVTRLPEQRQGTRQYSIVGNSPSLQQVFKLIDKVAPTHSNVLVQGESGTGKELVARSIHMNSPRRDRPFVTLNCSAVTETLFESELFGYERGAFTGAVQRKRGLLEEAHAGTILLDEIGEVPLAMQPKLLRVLQEGEIRRVGGTENTNIDVRVIAATNKDLAQEVAAGRFREDLYYRLNVIAIGLPPLRERKDDIPLLVKHFLEKHAIRSGDAPKTIGTETLHYLEAYDWPGNIRELENVIERAIVLEEGGSVQPRDLPPTLTDNTQLAGLKGEFCMDRPYRDAKQIYLDRFDKAYCRLALERASGNVTAAAEAAGMDRSNFRKVLQKAGLDRHEFTRRSKTDTDAASPAEPPTD